MAKEILVVLKRKDEAAEIIPYIEKVVQPGMVVVFLVPIRSGGFQQLMNQLLAIHTGIQPAFLLSNSDTETLHREQILSAERQILSHCGALYNKGIVLGVSAYAGTFRTVIRDLAEKEEVDLVMMEPRYPSLAIRLLRKTGSFFHVFKSYGPSPVLLFHRGSVAAKSR